MPDELRLMLMKPKPKPKDKKQSPGSAALLPPIRLVHAFKEASKSSKPEADPSDEALAVEMLLIVSSASFAALSRLDDLAYQVIYGGENSGGSVDRRIVEEGYDTWLDAADSLVERLRKLENFGYESESIKAFWTAHVEALSFRNEIRERKQLERQAARSDQLASLAARLEVREKARLAHDIDRGAVG